MINQVIAGIGLGLLMAIMIGPVFFMLINISIKNGFRSAFYFALGVVLSDGFYISIIEFSKSLVGFLDSHRDWVAMVGGILLIAFGISSILSKVSELKDSEVKNDISSKDLILVVIKGFVMNALNPFVLFFWIGVSTTLIVNKSDHSWAPFLFFSATLATIFFTDLLKGALAINLKKIMTVRFISLLNKISGIGLILFGFRLIYLLWADQI
ncbi:MAG: LysE family translocator [Bacteroidota bacterium]|jgi:threonine/homoserine/homoserine lactone efflux protein